VVFFAHDHWRSGDHYRDLQPSGWAAVFTGVVCLALAFYGLGVLDVNWFGIVFLLLAFILFILDIKALRMER